MRRHDFFDICRLRPCVFSLYVWQIIFKKNFVTKITMIFPNVNIQSRNCSKAAPTVTTWAYKNFQSHYTLPIIPVPLVVSR